MATDMLRAVWISKSCRTSSTMNCQSTGRLCSPYRAYRSCGSHRRALSLVCVDEHKLLRDIEKLLKKRSRALRFRAMSRTRQSKRTDPEWSPATWRRSWTRRWSGQQQPRRAEGGAKSASAKPAKNHLVASAMPNRQANNNVAASA